METGLAKHPYIEGTCIVCGPTKSQRWYYNKTTCRRCHRISVYETDRVLREREIKRDLKNNPKCWECESTESPQWYKDYTQCSKCNKREWSKSNQDHIREYSKNYRLRNLEKIRERKRRYRAKTGKHKFLQSKRKAVKLKALPKWLNRKELEKVYRDCPSGMTVDHILPLQNEHICGLHVPWNLQYLSLSENSKKHNRFDFTYENEGYKLSG